MNKYDLSILGAGPGGYVAALYAAQFGMKVCLIEEDRLGGVCLNYGCIPTKTLLASAKLLSQIKNSEKLGIKIENIKCDYPSIVKRKGEVVEKLKGGIESLLKARNISIKRQRGILEDKNTIRIGEESVRSKYIIIATGSGPIDIPCAKIDGKAILSSKEMLEIDSIPKKLVIIGGGAIGCEFASIFSEFGTHVTIVEMMQYLIPGSDRELSKRLEVTLKKKNIEVLTSLKAESVCNEAGRSLTIRLSDGRDLTCDKLLISAGTKPKVNDIGLEKTGVKFDKSGIRVDSTLKTNVDNIYAIGDCIGGFMYAHVASYEGIIACNNISGSKEHVDYSAVPSCVFTNPDIASSGLNEEEAREKGLDISISKFHLRSLGKAHALGKTDGFIKMVSDKKTKKILGFDIMGESSSDLIAEATLAIRQSLKVDDLLKTIHAHPTMAEAILEVAHIADGKPIHTL